jgi:lysine/ornithine N-monooxygenase
MPPGLVLRSAWEETSLWAGDETGSISAWANAVGVDREEPLRLEPFLAYADWFRRRFVHDRVEADVTRVERAGGRFRVTAADGESIETRHVVVAVGALPFSDAPAELGRHVGDRVVFATDLPRAIVGAGQAVAVVGAGQAAVEAAKLATQKGAAVELLARKRLHWFADREPWRPRGPLTARLYRLAYPALGYGPPPLNRIVLHPDLFALLPRSAQERLARRVLRPGASMADQELLEREASISEGVSVNRIEPERDVLRLRLSDGTLRTASLVVLATGYRFQLDRLRWLAPDIRGDVRLAGSWPNLDRGCQSSVAGLRFVGYAAEGRYGPLSRFVLGVRFTAERVSSAIARQSPVEQ